MQSAILISSVIFIAITVLAWVFDELPQSSGFVEIFDTVGGIETVETFCDGRTGRRGELNQCASGEVSVLVKFVEDSLSEVVNFYGHFVECIVGLSI